ncbi:MAG: DUF3267 domain-containing protein [Aggregatilineales bacterium]
MFNRPEPIHVLPEDYREVRYLRLTEPQLLLWLNVLSFVLLVPFFFFMVWWTGLVQDIRGAQTSGEILWWVGWFGVLLVFPLHEWLHGVAIRWMGHRPRYGMKTFTVLIVKVPYVLFATADNALFRRGEFVVIALAPVMVITLVGMGVMLIAPYSLHTFIAIAVILNGGGAIGDLWMTLVVLRHPSDSLVRDEEDSLRIYERYAAS